MKHISRHSTSLRLPSVRAAFYLLFIFFCAFIGCGKSDDVVSGRKPEPGGTREPVAAAGQKSGYMDIKNWERAKAEMKTNEEVIKAFNGYHDIWGWAYEHRTFLRFKKALETAAYLPGKMDEVEKVVGSIRSVPGYPDIDEMKDCYMKMIPLLRTGAEHLRLSIAAARDKNDAAEKKHEQVYIEKYKKAMAYSRKTFALMQEIYLRGSRTEYRKLAGEKKHDSSTAGTFRADVRKIMTAYETSIVKKITALTKLAAQAQWDLAIPKTDEVATLLQASIMETGRVEPGDLKELWDAKQALLTLLSHQMMGMKKFREYMEKAKTGDAQGAGKAKNIYEILRKSAEKSHEKLKKMGY